MDRSDVTRWGRSNSDGLLTVAVLLVALATSAPEHHWPTAARVLLTLLAWAPLTVRARWPVPVAGMVVVFDTISIVVAAHTHPTTGTLPAASMLALFATGRHCSARSAWTVALVTALLQFGVAAATMGPDIAPDLLYLNWAMVATIIGRLVRERHERIAAADDRADAAERSKASEARRQVTEERMRIARDLHDVLAHHITVVNAQAGVAQYLMHTDLAAAEIALAGIANNSRAALDDLRATLGLLRAQHEQTPDRLAPAPGLDDLPVLLSGFSDLGARIDLETLGSRRPLSGPAELAAYRITQEALTNARKHARGSAVSITLDWRDDTLRVAVVNTAPTAPGPAADGTGHGLIGISERAVAAGGTVLVGPTDTGGYRVEAILPLMPPGRSGDGIDLESRHLVLREQP